MEKFALVRMIEAKEKLHQEGLLAFLERFDKREHLTYDKSLEFDLELSRLAGEKEDCVSQQIMAQKKTHAYESEKIRSQNSSIAQCGLTVSRYGCNVVRRWIGSATHC